MNSKHFTVLCSEHNTFVWVVDCYNLITIRRVWSSWYSHTVCLASTDHPHVAFDLIGFSRMLVRCRTLSTADADRTPSIDVCRLLGCSRSSAKIFERLMKLSLKFGGLTTLVAHFLTSRTLGRNPRVHKKSLRPLLSSFLFFSFLFSCTRLFSCHPSLIDVFFACPILSPF